MIDRLFEIRVAPASSARMWALGACVALSSLLGGCDSSTLRGEAAPPQTARKKAAYIFRNTPQAYEGITLQRDGTYNRVVVDKRGRTYNQQGTWRGYGGTIPAGQQNRIDKRIELDDYSEPSDVVRTGGAQGALKSTRSLSASDFMH